MLQEAYTRLELSNIFILDYALHFRVTEGEIQGMLRCLKGLDMLRMLAIALSTAKNMTYLGRIRSQFCVRHVPKCYKLVLEKLRVVRRGGGRMAVTMFGGKHGGPQSKHAKTPAEFS